MSERDRLTELLVDTIHEWECDISIETVTEIAEHLIENGVIVPPCKVGDTVYIIGKYQGLYEATVRKIFFNERKTELIRTTKCDVPIEDLGKTVFLTREEAEKALKEGDEE